MYSSSAFSTELGYLVVPESADVRVSLKKWLGIFVGSQENTVELAQALKT